MKQTAMKCKICGKPLDKHPHCRGCRAPVGSGHGIDQLADGRHCTSCASAYAWLAEHSQVVLRQHLTQALLSTGYYDQDGAVMVRKLVAEGRYSSAELHVGTIRDEALRAELEAEIAGARR